MKNALIINAHQYYPFAEGKLNAAMFEKIGTFLEGEGYQIKSSDMKSEWNVDEEVEKHQWAELIILQSPVNWMGVPWSFKKYMDEVYTAGMGGQMCNGDGRTRATPKQGYGTGGTLKGKKYMMSLTFNAPSEAFDNKEEWLFEGKSVDDLFFPMHMNFKFFGMEPLETFASFDVMKNPAIENDFERLQRHLNKVFKGEAS
ncbi:MAG: NAD(P)H-dependent oxidoreductase [Bdellovibrionales bacterium]|nr:NAD(P)H-dependent oxidoreductase [Bdellovibrionales bacterium]